MAQKTYVLVHGAYHGGWCWKRVADILRSRGHRVTTPTQTGLGERSHLLSDLITLPVFMDDILNHLRWEELTNVVLVGHSFGGIIITGVADVMAERIAQLIYFDAAVLENGEAMFDVYPRDSVARIEAAKNSSGLSVEAPPAEFFGLSDPADVAFVENRLTPHPIATFRSPLEIDGPVGNGLPINYIMCTDPVLEPVKIFHERARKAGWSVSELSGGHDAMVTEPSATADLLEKLADR